jgi:hypothetical protein
MVARTSIPLAAFQRRKDTTQLMSWWRILLQARQFRPKSSDHDQTRSIFEELSSPARRDMTQGIQSQPISKATFSLHLTPDSTLLTKFKRARFTRLDPFKIAFGSSVNVFQLKEFSRLKPSC